MDYSVFRRTKKYRDQKVCVVMQNQKPKSYTVMGLNGKAFLATRTFKEFDDAMDYFDWMVDKFKDEKIETTPIGFIGRL